MCWCVDVLYSKVSFNKDIRDMERHYLLIVLKSNKNIKYKAVAVRPFSLQNNTNFIYRALCCLSAPMLQIGRNETN